MQCDRFTDVCEDYCENGGKCEIPQNAIEPRCVCHGNFYGERCERKSDFVYVAGGITAAVVFIIVMVLLIWMICVRYAQTAVNYLIAVVTRYTKRMSSKLTAKACSRQCSPGAFYVLSLMRYLTIIVYFLGSRCLIFVEAFDDIKGLNSELIVAFWNTLV